MRDAPRRQMARTSDGVEVRPCAVPRLTKLCLLRPSDADIRVASAKLGLELPLAPNTIEGTPKTARLAPGEWLIFDGPNVAEIAMKLGSTVHAASDPTPGKAAWTIAGARAADLINAGCSLDLHPKVFRPGCIARTLLADASALISRPNEEPAFDLIVDQSLAHHISGWFGDTISARDPQAAETWTGSRP